MLLEERVVDDEDIGRAGGCAGHAKVVEKDGAVTLSHDRGEPDADDWTEDRSSWYKLAPDPDVSVKMTFVSWSSTDAERELPRLEGADVVDWVVHESPAKE